MSVENPCFVHVEVFLIVKTLLRFLIIKSILNNKLLLIKKESILLCQFEETTKLFFAYSDKNNLF